MAQINKLYIDFETRSKIDLKKCGAVKYARDISTTILCIGYAWNNEPVELIPYITNGVIPMDLSNHLMQIKNGNGKLVAHNAFFERSIWKHKLFRHEEHQLHELAKPEFWIDTMAKARACSYPGKLDTVAKILGLSEKDAKGHRLMLKMSKPRKPTKNNKSIWHDKQEDFQRLYEYCKQDIVVERELDKALPNLSKAEQAIWYIDQEINDSGLPLNVSHIKKAIDYNNQIEEKNNNEIYRITKGQIKTVGQVGAIKDYINSKGIKAESVNKETIEDLLKQDIPTDVRKVLLARRGSSKSSVKKYDSLLKGESNGRIHGVLQYHTASTGRWSGSRFQPQNLPRGDAENIDTSRYIFLHSNNLNTYRAFYGGRLGRELSSLIRASICTNENKMLITADYAAIEARCVVWLAKCRRGLKKFRDNEDIYVDMARSIFQNNKLTPADSFERFVGKQAVLGCGYGMGPDRFQAQAAQYGQEIPFELAERAVKTYRSAYAEIPKFWYLVERTAKNAILNPGKTYHAYNIYMKSNKKYLKIRLPSGRILYYVDPVITEGDLEYMGWVSQIQKWQKIYTYGGKLVENITQGVARDILANALVNLRDTDYNVILHVHDEIVTEVDSNKGNVDEFVKLITDVPAWADGCPIKAEGWAKKYYCKM